MNLESFQQIKFKTIQQMNEFQANLASESLINSANA